MRRFHAPAKHITENTITLDVDETRHLRDVLRLRVGDEVFVFNGEGSEYKCSVLSIEKKSSQLTITHQVEPASPESPLTLTLAVAVLKGDKFDLVIQKAVELGVSTVIPLSTIRTDVKLKAGDKRTDRWRRIAMEATKQCGRARLMQVAEPVSLAELLTNPANTQVLMFSERDGEPFSSILPKRRMTAVLGPEGGWDDSELKFARSSNAQIITLSGRTLRAETAAISIAAILQHRFGDVN